jgi:branched-chain amino acid transport system ATP-binding protein
MSAPESPAAALFELRDVSASYGPFRAIFGVSLEVPAGKAVALLGSNGAGKTTIARVCSGLLKPTSGRLLFAGDDITGQRAYRLARLGIMHAPEGRSVFATLSVEENLALSFRRAVGRAGVPAALDRAYELFPRLAGRRRQLAGTLSGGEQRMLALARVLVSPPQLLICVVEEVYRILRTIRDAGTALLLVEQHVRHALDLADEVVVLTKGEVVLRGAAADLREELGERLLPAAHGEAV